MQIQRVGNSYTHPERKNDIPLHPFISMPLPDTVNFSSTKISANKDILFHQSGNVTHVVMFKGLKNPVKQLMPAIQMKVSGVTKLQDGFNLGVKGTGNIDLLAYSDWKDGEELRFELNQASKTKQILLIHPVFGDIGRVPDAIAKKLFDTIQKDVSNFRFELSNIISGNSKGAATTGLRVNLLYKGGNSEKLETVQKSFNDLLNSDDKECAEKIMLHQPKTSPGEALKVILDYEEKTNGIASAQKMSAVIENIANALKDPANKKILLIGHSKPDGDTIGCVLGLKNAIALLGSNKQVDCAIDDKIPGLFRHNLPGLDETIKMPQGSEYIANLQNQITALSKLEKTESTKKQIELFEKEVQELKKPEKLISKSEKYDLVILMDIPTPKRFTNGFKPFIESAKNVIYIDHHPHRFNEWEKAQVDNGLDMKKVQNNNLSLVAEAVPSATELVAVIAGKFLPWLNDVKKLPLFVKSQEQITKLNAFVASIVTGTATDTGSTRTANLLPEHATMAVQDRPNFLPEGFSKWLMDLTGGKISKKWLHDTINYDISDTKSDKVALSARDLMLTHALGGKKVYEDLSLGVISVDYKKINEVWSNAHSQEPETILLDVINSFKYSEVMGILRSDPELQSGGSKASNELSRLAKLNYIGKYDDDRIAVFICQDKKKGELDEKFLFAKENGLRLSLRSGSASNHAELLASLFGGGGHGGAAGGRVDLPGVELNSKLGILINGAIEKDSAKILAELKSNYKINNDHSISDLQKKQLTSKIEIVMDQAGKTCEDLIVSVTQEIRKSYENK